MQETGAEHVWLDAREFGPEKWRVRFPTIYETLLSHGIDPVEELIPVVPACHYASGGIRTDLLGETSVSGLFACGESACTGVHGANRLASNSLLEGLVFGRRIADTVAARLDEPRPPVPCEPPPAAGTLLDDAARAELQRIMSAHAGVLRDQSGLDAAELALGELSSGGCATPGTPSWEATNLLTVARVLIRVARLRKETRGSHWRDDFRDRDDDRWRGHLDSMLTGDGAVSTDFVPLSPVAQVRNGALAGHGRRDDAHG
jgi:L-aspartate oxidase